MRPIHMKKEDLEPYRGKMVKVVMESPVRVRNKDIESMELRGYFHQVACAANDDNPPVYLYFVHESISGDPKVRLHKSNTTYLQLMRMVSIDLDE